MRAHGLLEDKFLHSSFMGPAVAGAQIEHTSVIKDSCGQVRKVNDEQGDTTASVVDLRMASAYFAWRANDPSGKIYFAKTMGLSARE